MSGRWVKSHKIVRFPHNDLDPTKYLAPRSPSSQVLVSAPSSSQQVLDEEGQGERSTFHHIISNGQSKTGTGTDLGEVAEFLMKNENCLLSGFNL